MSPYFILISLFLLLPQMGHGQSHTASLKKTPRSSQAATSSATPPKVRSKLIKKELTSELPKFICSEDSQTIRCHKISRKKCKKLIKKGLRFCMKKNPVKRMVSSIESMRYSQTIGLCLKDKTAPYIEKHKRDCVDRK